MKPLSDPRRIIDWTSADSPSGKVSNRARWCVRSGGRPAPSTVARVSDAVAIFDNTYRRDRLTIADTEDHVMTSLASAVEGRGRHDRRNVQLSGSRQPSGQPTPVIPLRRDIA